MRSAAIVVLLSVAAASAQTEVAPARAERLRREFAAHPDAAPLRCEVTPVPPALSFAFRFQAGYTLHVPRDQYPGSTRGWRVFTTITPADGSHAPTFLLAGYPPANVSQEGSNFDLSGFYLLGAGRYSVESAVRDDRNRICRKQWQVVVKTPRGLHPVPLALPPGAVRPFSTRSWPDTLHPGGGAPIRLSVLLNAAAFSTRRTVLRPADRMVLLHVLTALVERLPTSSVRLVVFSLEQQKEVFRSDGFALSALDKVAEAFDALHLASVDVHVLEKPLGHVDFLASLVNRELRAPDPADTVIFLGPSSRYGNKIPAPALEKPAGGKPRFFYVQYQAPLRAPTPAGGVLPGLSRGGASSQSGTASEGNPLPSGGSPAGGGGGGIGGGVGGGGMGGAGGGGMGGVGGGGMGGVGGGGMGGGGMGGVGGGGMGRGGGGGGRGGGRGGREMGPAPAPGEGRTDIISAAISRFQGKTLVIHSPGDLARAIRKIEGGR